MAHTTREPQKKNGYSNGIVNKIDNSYHENITTLDLSRRNISVMDETIKLPPNLNELCLSHNKFIEVPKIVLEMLNLKILDISHNSITYFNEVPKFCDTLEQLNIACNKLKAPPQWIWTCRPNKLKKLNISCNQNIINNLKMEELENIIHNKSLLTEVDIHNCGFKNHVQLLSTLTSAKILKIGDTKYDYNASNALIDLPCKALYKCCDIESLNACNTHLYTVNPHIDIYKHLKHIDLSQNYLHSLPNEFCNLLNLEICILSNNKFLYLPDIFYTLTKLIVLLLDSNDLCMLPQNIDKLENLKVLDLYDNYLNDVPTNVEHIEKVDYAQNYFEEPENKEYLLKKKNLRLNINNRIDGRKLEVIRSESEDGSDDLDFNQLSIDNESSKAVDDLSTSSEDWDSDEYWIPQYYKSAPVTTSPWFHFVKKKIEEGHFCPVDAHPISVIERVKYEKLCNPLDEYESDGQFDDYSDDNSY